MKKLLPFISLLLLAFTAGAQGIEFFHGTWEEALQKAKSEDRLVFVDAFAVWCGPCKRMAATTFTDPEVGELINTYFVPLKIDMEKGMGLEFRKTYPVSAFPTLFFIDENGEVIQKAVGARAPADLIQMAEEVLSKYDKSVKYASAYEAGDRSYTLVYNYVKALNKSGKPSNKIANDYLETQEDLSTPENLQFILEAASQVDCQCFDLFEKYKKDILKISSADEVQAKVRQACTNTLNRAIEFESPELITIAAEAMKRHIPGEADEFLSAGKIKYALAMHDLSGVESMVNTHVKKYVKNDPEQLYLLALTLEKYAADDPALMKQATDLAGKAAKGEDVKYVSTFANLTMKTSGKDDALKILDDALAKFKGEESKDATKLRELRDRIANS